jgi:hypothetical protein
MTNWSVQYNFIRVFECRSHTCINMFLSNRFTSSPMETSISDFSTICSTIKTESLLIIHKTTGFSNSWISITTFSTVILYFFDYFLISSSFFLFYPFFIFSTYSITPITGSRTRGTTTFVTSSIIIIIVITLHTLLSISTNYHISLNKIDLPF